ncbi:hypothetical protein BDD21_2462 [Thiocapsa rosea]|uniref:Uncharacterized protein n=1 Tax=Thiocapsa rosea TaxID=69360 RepID=A0A495VB60_9GAMM|nr:hypothetical protein BDD21_2462 [Thiocapsa rosea]
MALMALTIAAIRGLNRRVMGATPTGDRIRSD